MRTGAERVLGAAVVLCAVLLGASGAGAVSLADLVAGGSLTTQNGVVYDHFKVKIRGGLNDDLSTYEVFAGEDGFILSADGRDARGRDGKGKIVLRYDVSTEDPTGLLGSLLEVHEGGATALVSATKKIFDGSKKIARLFADSNGAGDEVDLAGLGTLSVREKIKVNGGFAGGSVSSGFVASAVPEPSTLLLAGLGLSGLVALGRRRA